VTLSARAEVAVWRTRRSSARAALAATRPRQWTKNLLVLAGIVFAGRLGDTELWTPALAVLAAYCAASSAAYLVNDVRDVAGDRLHPVKRLRPIASGELAAGAALRLAAGLVGAAVALAAVAGAASVLVLLAFLALQGLYTSFLRGVAAVDVTAIAGLFVIRAAAGAVAIDVRISPWLLACTGLLALLLALGKRRAERVSADVAVHTRRALAAYTRPAVDRWLAGVAATTVAVYAAYALSARESVALAVTIPFVVFGVGRYLMLVHARGAGEDPEAILLQDVPTLVTVAAWAATCAVVLATIGAR